MHPFLRKGSLIGGTIKIFTSVSPGPVWYIDFTFKGVIISRIEGSWWGKPATKYGTSGSDECAFSWEKSSKKLTLWDNLASGLGPLHSIAVLDAVDLPAFIATPRKGRLAGSGSFGPAVVAGLKFKWEIP